MTVTPLRRLAAGVPGLLLAGALAAPPAAAQEGTGSLAGRVLDDSTRTPLFGARVLLLGTKYAAGTDETGRFRLAEVPAGPYVLQVRYIGYETVSLPISLAPGQALQLDVSLVSSGFVLPDIVVRGQGRPGMLDPKLASFYDRMRTNAGFGTFLTPQFLNERNPQFTTDALRNVPGIRVTCGSTRTNAGGGCEIAFQRSAGAGIGTFGAGQCPPIVFLDGMFMRMRPQELDQMIPAQQIYGIEIYKGQATPPEFNYPGAACGVLAIWSGDRFAERDRARDRAGNN